MLSRGRTRARGHSKGPGSWAPRAAPGWKWPSPFTNLPQPLADQQEARPCKQVLLAQNEQHPSARALSPARPCPRTHSHRLQRLHNDPVDLVEQLAGHLLAPGALQVEPQVVHGPLAPVDVVVVFLAKGSGVRVSGNVPEEPRALEHSPSAPSLLQVDLAPGGSGPPTCVYF